MKKDNLIRNQKGQSLIEYLVIVAFVGIASIGVVRVLGKNITINLANISNALGNKQKITGFEDAKKYSKNKKDFTNFMDDANEKK